MNRESTTSLAQGHPQRNGFVRQWMKWLNCWMTLSTKTSTCFAYQVHNATRTTANTLRMTASSSRQDG